MFIANIAIGCGILFTFKCMDRKFEMLRSKRARSVDTRCVIDPESAGEAERLVRAVAGSHENVDTLIVKLVRIYTSFLPKERCLQSMSLEQQRLSGFGSASEFCCCIVYTAMMTAIIESRPPLLVGHVKRSQSIVTFEDRCNQR